MCQTLQALSVNKTRFLLCGSYLWKTDIQTSRMSAAQTQGEVPPKQPGVWEGFTKEAASRLWLEEHEELVECKVEGPTGENGSFQRSSECGKKVESRS